MEKMWEKNFKNQNYSAFKLFCKHCSIIFTLQNKLNINDRRHSMDYARKKMSSGVKNASDLKQTVLTWTFLLLAKKVASFLLCAYS